MGATRTLTLTNGMLDFNGKNVSVGKFSSSNSNVRTLTMGSGTLTLTGTGTVWTTATATNLTLNFNTCAVVLTGASGTIAGSPTFYSLTASTPDAVITVTDGITLTVTNSFTSNGTSGHPVVWQGSSTGGWTIAMPVTQSISYVSVSRSTATGNTAVAGATSTDGGNNTNWTFGVSAPVAAFSGTPLTITVGGTVVFTDSSTNTPTSWLWNFGDGSTSTSQNPSHTYTAPGTYTVSLTATNAGGSDDEVKAAYVTVKTGAGLGIGIAVMRQRRGRR